MGNLHYSLLTLHKSKYHTAVLRSSTITVGQYSSDHLTFM